MIPSFITLGSFTFKEKIKRKKKKKEKEKASQPFLVWFIDWWIDFDPNEHKTSLP